MIARLVRQDPALESLPVALVLAVAIGFFLRMLVSAAAEGSGDVLSQIGESWVGLNFLSVWYVGLMLLLSGNVSTRCSQLSLTLPLPARRLWHARMIALFTICALPWVIITLIVGFRSEALTAGGAPFDTGVLVLGAQAIGAYLLMIAVTQSPHPDRDRLAHTAGYWTFLIAVAAGIAVLLGFTAGSPWATAAIWLVAVLLALRIRRRIPAAFRTVPTEVGKRRSFTRTTSKPRSGKAATPPIGVDAPFVRPRRWLLQATLARCFLGHPLSMLLLLVTCGYAFMMVKAYFDGDEVWFQGVAIVAWIHVVIYQAVIRLARVDAWPVARRAHVAAIAVPILCSLAAGAAIGFVVESVAGPEQFSQIALRQGRLEYPSEYMQVAWDGDVPPVTAPWGEQYAPRPLAIAPGVKVAVYDPYGFTEDHSPAFIAFQVERAVRAIHGGKYASGSAAHADSLELGMPKMIGMRSIPLHPDAPAPGRARMFALATFLTAMFSGLFTSMGLGQFSNTLRPGLYKRTMTAIAGLAMLGILGSIALNNLGYVDFDAVTALPLILLRKLGEWLPVSGVVLWAVAGLGVGAAYAIIQRRFQRLEAPLGLTRSFMREH